jgi:hypothetical protein
MYGENAAGPQAAHQVGDEGLVVLDVFDDVEGQDDVESTFGEGQVGCGDTDHVPDAS